MEKRASPQGLTRLLATGFLVWPRGTSHPLANSFQCADHHISPSFPPNIRTLTMYTPDTVLRPLHIPLHCILLITVQGECRPCSQLQIRELRPGRWVTCFPLLGSDEEPRSSTWRPARKGGQASHLRESSPSGRPGLAAGRLTNRSHQDRVQELLPPRS